MDDVPSNESRIHPYRAPGMRGWEATSNGFAEAPRDADLAAALDIATARG
jgi:hypothetical protein